MSTWTPEQLSALGGAEELQVSSYRADGTLRPFTTIWGVRVGDDVYVRSAYGPGNGWYRHARAAGTGRVRAAGVDTDVTYEQAPASTGAEVDAAYHAKYDGHGPAIVGTVVGPQAAEVTLRVVPGA